MASPRPLIGITTYPPSPGGRYVLPQEYVASVRRAGGEPVLLPPGSSDQPADVTTLLARLDGVVLAGGGDLDPATYGGDGHETIYALHAGRDRDELSMCREILDRELPTLAICRGSQVLNVALGGTLLTHLPDVVPGPGAGGVLHRVEPPEPQAIASPTPHEVTVDAGCRLAEVLGATTVTPMSWHHQAVDRLGDGLRVVARAPDGVVEATELAGHPWLLSVQWHPELTSATDPTQQRLFDALVATCAEDRTRTRGGNP